jgi:CHRD domain
MKRSRGLAAVVVAAMSVALVFALVGGASAGKKKKKTVKLFAPDMVGAVESPPGDPDGSGEAKFKMKKKKGQVCFNISFQGIDNPEIAHIHPGGPGEVGPPLIGLWEETTGLASPVKDCVDAEKSAIKQVIKNPGDFYVNIHNDAFPAGALRDQLQKKRGDETSGGGGGGGGGGLPY